MIARSVDSPTPTRRKYTKSLLGEKFGRLAVVGQAENQGSRTRWLCVCDCGNEKVLTKNRLTNGTKSCGCLARERASNLNVRDITGHRFGKLTAISRTQNKGQKPVWVCQCDCGASVTVIRSNLVTGNTVSCGCLQISDRGKYTTPEKRKKSATYTASRRGLVRGGGGTFYPNQVSVLFNLQRGRCANCRAELGRKFHRDHKMPLIMGGSNDISNIELLCQTCNLKKSAKDPIDWALENGRLL